MHAEVCKCWLILWTLCCCFSLWKTGLFLAATGIAQCGDAEELLQMHGNASWQQSYKTYEVVTL